MVEKSRTEKVHRKVIPLLPLSYFGPIEEYALLAQNNKVIYETKEHFVKQSYRNRCHIYGANGEMRLTVPLVMKSREKTPMDKIKVSYSDKWQAQHWKTIVSAYKNSPFFEHYAEDLLSFFLTEFEYLIDLNKAAQNIILKHNRVSIDIFQTNEFELDAENDFRQIIHPKKVPFVLNPRYIQVFEGKHEFQPNLSILDLLFNEGPASNIYLQFPI
jgi:hypothetical protein